MIALSRSPSRPPTSAPTGAQTPAALLRAAGVKLSTSAETILSRVHVGDHIRGADVVPAGLCLSMQSNAEVIAVTDADLRTINASHSARTLTADEVVVFQDYACSTARIPSPPIRFTRAYLDRMAACATEGRTVLFDHDEQEPIGTTFAGDVVEETVRGVKAEWLRIRWYAVVNDETSKARRQRVQDCQTGVLRYASIRALGGVWDFQETELPNGQGGTTWDYFYLVDDAPDANLGEHSRVFLGAATGAGDHKFTAATPSGDGSPAPGQTPASPDATPGVVTKPRLVCVL